MTEGHTWMHIWIWIPILATCISSVASYGQIPTFTNTPVNVTTSQGSEAIMRCGVENLGTKTVSWRKLPYNVPITVGKEQFLELDRFKLVQMVSRSEWNLHIKNAQPFDSGTYECQVSLKGTFIRRNVTLVVYESSNDPTKPSIHISGTQFVEKGSPILLTCNVTSDDMPQSVDWFFEGRVVQTSYERNVYIHQQVSLSERLLTSTLSIGYAQMADMGKYVCRASKDLAIRINVDVLNAGTYNEKRDTPEEQGSSLTSSSGVLSVHISSVSSSFMCLYVYLTIMCIPGLTTYKVAA
ncbi:neural cell adhesion molecule 2-like [Dreissena polymorpha]|uniref:Ig-like domain-containing protein n=1 Tax=Dreissena polymorpha TaxID=45954 RepID=A0A9D4KB13_DREPO|nr:neural cell adhesion molecule 2-like [Dreissena polymorpha]KAH3836495.1 hypothetical protein DPMN_109866 [Dreissena polymorpha]